MIRDTYEGFQQKDRGLFGDNEMAPQPKNDNTPRVTGASDLIDLTLILREDRPVSIAVSDPKKPIGPWIWLPKSQIEYAHARGGYVEVAMPEWLAKREGLV